MPRDNQFPMPRSTGDVAYVAAKSVLAFIPPAGELLQFVLQSPLEKRRDDWFRSVEERLQALEQQKGIDLSQLQQNEQFVSAVLQATQSALRTHQSEKLAALQNAISNLAQGLSIDDTILFILLSYIETLSDMHVRILRILHEIQVPSVMFDGEMHAWSELPEYHLPELRNNAVIRADQFISGLQSGNLIDVVNPTPGTIQPTRAEDMQQRRSLTTPLGKSLLQLIASN